MESVIESACLTLACHPKTPCRAIQSIGVVVGGRASGDLALAFTMEGDLSALRIPNPRPSRKAHGLWRHSCFEAFVMAGEGPGYREFNFLPSGEWAVYGFHSYREGAALEIARVPTLVTRRTGNRLELEAEICRESLPQGRPLRLGLSAVVEDADGVLSYWALQHPPGEPDFHHPDSFAMQLLQP